METESGVLVVLTVSEVAALLACSEYTVQEAARLGDLPAMKPGGSWVFPGKALHERLNEKATTEAAERRAGRRDPLAVAFGEQGAPRRGRPRSKLPDALK
jgi:excisionase family DNA binding protein